MTYCPESDEYVEYYTANLDGWTSYSFTVMPDEGEPLDAIATVEITSYYPLTYLFYNDGFEDFDFVAAHSLKIQQRE